MKEKGCLQSDALNPLVSASQAESFWPGRSQSGNCPTITDGSWEMPRAMNGQVTLVNLKKTSFSQSCWGVLEAYVRLILGLRLGVLRKINPQQELPLEYILSANKWVCSWKAQNGQFDFYKELWVSSFLDALTPKIAIKYSLKSNSLQFESWLLYAL